MRRRRLRRPNYLSFLPLLIAFSPPISHAQANIDPALPPAPLERGAYFSIFPEYEVVSVTNGSVPPLTVRQKFEIAYRKTFSPALPIDSLAIAGFDQATNLGPAYGQEWGAFGKRVGYNAANFTAKALFSFGIVPAAFHQDPRYFRLGSGSIHARMLWVLRSQVAAFSDRGTAMPNYGKLIGYAASTALSNVYMPAQSVSRGNDLEGYGIKFGASILVSTIHEFDLTRLLERRHSHP
jgi:hypothetical protein